MDDYDAIVKGVLALQLKKECRMSERQIALLRWTDIGNREIKVSRHRTVKISRELYRALMAAPVRSGYVFSTSPLIPFGIPPEKKRLDWRRLIPKFPRIRNKIERV